MDKIDQLAAIPMFQGLPEHQLKELSDIVISQTRKRGEAIFSEGEKAHGFFVVVSGRIRVFKLSFEGKEQILHILGPGEPFGEVPVFVGKDFPANAEAMEPSELLYFQRERFVNLINRLLNWL